MGNEVLDDLKSIEPKQQKKDGRETFILTLTGGTNTGKSYKAREVAKSIGGRVLVISFSGSGETWDDIPEIPATEKALKSFKGFAKMRWIKNKLNPEPLLLTVFKYYRNGTIIFDDCKQYMKANIEHTPNLIDIVAEHRHKGYDLIFAAHTPMQIPKDVWSYVKNMWVFKCYQTYKEDDLYSEAKGKILKAQKIVNKRFNEAKKAGKKTYGIYIYLES